LIVWFRGKFQDKISIPGYDSLPPTQVAKNTLVVGAIEGITVKKETYDKSDVGMPTFSSWGPTDDGRIKPDVVAAGNNLYAPVAFVPGSIPPAESNESYRGNLSGTSFAAPTVTGTAVLLIEHYRNLFGTLPLSATTKGLLTHTAFDAGNVGPDYSHGWGLVDAAANFLTLLRVQPPMAATTNP
jgi:subtilisin family serine protease